MGKIKDFYQLDAWKESRKLVVMVYKETESFPKEERYGTTGQLRRAVISITANIAEGFGRYHYADKIRFYHQARGSAKEVQNFVLLGKDLGYLRENVASDLWQQTKAVEKLINGLIRATEAQK